MKCRSLRKYGHDACDQPPHLQGGFAEYCVIDAGTRLLKLPDSLSDVIAAPANCATATIVAGWEAAEIQAGESVLIQGAGALGCYAAAYAANAGCCPVIVCDIDPRRLELIRRFGATDIIDSSQIGASETIARAKQRTYGFGVDCVLEVAGKASLVEIGISALRKGGRYIEIGCSYPGASVALDMSTILWNLLSIHGVHNYDVRHLRKAIDFLASTTERFPWAEVVGETFTLDQINQALHAAESGESLRVAVAFDVS
jgi:threonine dehydrogenase-like Zn-dependent dehydrogenase